VRETVELDDTAPAFGEALSMIQSERLSDARAILEIALRQHPDSAALYFDIAAISEALGDMTSAGEHFGKRCGSRRTASSTAPSCDLFHRRNEKAPPEFRQASS
jgi:thioredoxin-like negative regulator of GroEL